MAKSQPKFHLVPDPDNSALLILDCVSEEPTAIPVLPTRRATAFWGQFAHSTEPKDDDDHVG
jgi:hypothetical protein